MDSGVGHLSPTGSRILAPLSHRSSLAELNLNCRLKPINPPKYLTTPKQVKHLSVLFSSSPLAQCAGKSERGHTHTLRISE